MRTITKLLLVIVVSCLVPGCAISHSYGPYMGKIVDKETDEPIEGAVVFMRFFRVGLFDTHNFADAVEVVTNKDGEFLVPIQRIVGFDPLASFDPDGAVIIFKPGYGAYPGHPEVSPRFTPGGTLPANQHVTIKLPKLKTKEERSDNAIRNLWPGSGVPESKYRLFEKLKKSEFHYLDKGD